MLNSDALTPLVLMLHPSSINPNCTGVCCSCTFVCPSVYFVPTDYLFNVIESEIMLSAISSKTDLVIVIIYLQTKELSLAVMGKQLHKDWAYQSDHTFFEHTFKIPLVSDSLLFGANGFFPIAAIT